LCGGCCNGIGIVDDDTIGKGGKDGDDDDVVDDEGAGGEVRDWWLWLRLVEAEDAVDAAASGCCCGAVGCSGEGVHPGCDQ
jgi:hypothetical protein